MSQNAPTVAAEVRAAHVAGTLLIAAAVLEVAAMSHHPSVHSNDVGGIVAELGRMSALTGMVHGTLMVLMLVSLYCLTQHCVQRGPRRPLVRAGLIVYAAGTLAMLGAALVSGFLVVDVASHLAYSTPAEEHAARQLLMWCHAINQVLAKAGTAALSAGIALWSIDLLRSAGLARWIGVLGCAIGLLPMAGLGSGLLRLDVHGMGAVVLLQTCWSIGMGLLIYRSTYDEN